MATITEIAPDVYRICTYVPAFDLQFCQFLVKDDEPLLFHTGMRAMFADVSEAVARVIDPASLRWISFSHFEPDECGALNEWLALAPRATAVTTEVGAGVFITDYAIRPPRALTDEETLATGRYRFRLLATRHLPHGWDAGMLFEETQRTLFCTDLFHQGGDVEPSTESDVVGRFRDTVTAYQATPLKDYLPYTPRTAEHIERLAALSPRTCATMHGSAYIGDGSKALRDLGIVLKDVYGS